MFFFKEDSIYLFSKFGVEHESRTQLFLFFPAGTGLQVYSSDVGV